MVNVRPKSISLLIPLWTGLSILLNFLTVVIIINRIAEVDKDGMRS